MAISAGVSRTGQSPDSPEEATAALHGRTARLITFPPEDSRDLENFSAVRLGSAGVCEYSAYDANDLFSTFRRKRRVTWNLERGSSMKNGQRRDGSFVAGCQVIIPSLLFADFPNFEQHLLSNPQLMLELESPGVAKFKERYSILKGGTEVDAWRLPKGCPPVGNDRYQSYAPHELYPYLKAAANGSNFVLRCQREAAIIRPIKPIDEIYCRLARIKTLDKFCVSSSNGLVVAAPWRFLISLTWLLISISIGTAAAVHNADDWYDSMESFFTASILVAITLPGIAALLFREPDLIRNAIRGKRTLTSDQDVASWFGLVEKDYAAAALSLNGTALVSESRGCFLAGRGNPALSGDGYLVSGGTLQRVGVLVGRAIYRKVWEDANKISEEVDNGVSHLTSVAPITKWASSSPVGRLVGGALNFRSSDHSTDMSRQHEIFL